MMTTFDLDKSQNRARVLYMKFWIRVFEEYDFVYLLIVNVHKFGQLFEIFF